MSTDLLEGLAANAMHIPTILTLETSIYNVYNSIPSQRMMVSSPSLTLDLIDICIFCKFMILVSDFLQIRNPTCINLKSLDFIFILW